MTFQSQESLQRQTSLHLFVGEGNLEKVNLLLDWQYADLNEPDADGNTALALAVIRNDVPLVRRLLQERAILADKPNRLLQTPLFHALASSSPAGIEIAKILLARDDVKADQPDVHQNLPLHVLVSRTFPVDTDVLYQLAAKHGVAIDSPNAQGDTPLHCAARTGQLDAWVLFLRLGANPSLPNAAGETPSALVQLRRSATHPATPRPVLRVRRTLPLTQTPSLPALSPSRRISFVKGPAES